MVGRIIDHEDVDAGLGVLTNASGDGLGGEWSAIFSVFSCRSGDKQGDHFIHPLPATPGVLKGLKAILPIGRVGSLNGVLAGREEQSVHALHVELGRGAQGHQDGQSSKTVSHELLCSHGRGLLGVTVP